MRNTKVIVDKSNAQNYFSDLQQGDYFVVADEYGDWFLYLYIDTNCIINVEDGEKVDTDFFSQFNEIKLIKEIKITIEK